MAIEKSASLTGEIAVNARQWAQRITVQNLLHCLLREIPDNFIVLDDIKVLNLPLKSQKNVKIYAPLISNWPEANIGWPWKIAQTVLSAEELKEIIIQEISCRLGEENQSMRHEIICSQRFIQQFLQEGSLESCKGFSESRKEFIYNEQNLKLGHRYHPSPKSRDGLPEVEWFKYSPECHTSFSLFYLLIPAELNLQGGIALQEKFQELSGYSCPDGWNLLPIHPIQQKLLSTETEYIDKLQKGVIRELGIMGRELYPTSSIRTLYDKESDFFLKFSLNLRITNWVRRNTTQEMLASVELSNHIVDILPDLRENLILETGFCVFRDIDNLGNPTILQESLGILYREGFHERCPARWHITPACTLFEEEIEAEGLLSIYCQKDKPGFSGRLEIFFYNYIKSLLSLGLSAYEKGLLLEPHLQNTIVAISEDLQCKIFLRDMDSVRFIEDNGKESKKYASYESETAWKRLSYTMIINNIFECCKAILRLSPSSEEDLQHLCVKALEELVEEGCVSAKEILGGKVLWYKANLFTRWMGLRDSQAPFREFGAWDFKRSRDKSRIML